MCFIRFSRGEYINHEATIHCLRMATQLNRIRFQIKQQNIVYAHDRFDKQETKAKHLFSG